MVYLFKVEAVNNSWIHMFAYYSSLPWRWIDELIHLSAYTSLPTAMGKWGGFGEGSEVWWKRDETKTKDGACSANGMNLVSHSLSLYFFLCKMRKEDWMGWSQRLNWSPVKTLASCMESSGASMSYGTVSLGVKRLDLYTPDPAAWAVPGLAVTLARKLSPAPGNSSQWRSHCWEIRVSLTLHLGGSLQCPPPCESTGCC